MTPLNKELVEKVARVERQLARSNDSFEAPSGKIMYRVWVNDLTAVTQLARKQLDATAALEASPIGELIEALNYARESLGDPVPVSRRHVARVIDAVLAKVTGVSIVTPRGERD